MASKPGAAKAIDHTTGVAPEVEPAGLLANRLVRAAVLLWHGLEPLSKDYALATLVWSQQTASAEQIRAITNEAKQKGHPKGVLFVLAPSGVI